MSKNFVLRTSALLSSRESTLRFDGDNTIVIPLSVVDEIRAMKYGSTEKSRIAKSLLEYLNSFDAVELMSANGVVQKNGSTLRVVKECNDMEIKLEGLSVPERKTLQVCRKLKETTQMEVILVTNNLSLQLKAKFLGIKAESFKDETFPMLSDQYTGREMIYTSDEVIDLFYEKGFLSKKDIFNYSEIEFVENKFFLIGSINKSALGMYKNGKIVKLNYTDTFPYGIVPKNVGQKFMLEALLSEDFPLVVIKGGAGTGKTFCALATALEKTEKGKRYSRILVTRSVTATEQYGFLPGDIEEKLSPYLSGIKDNLSILINGAAKRTRGSKEEYEDGQYFFEKGIVQIQAIGFLRGRSIVDTFFIIDETQNIDPDTIKSIVTRTGEGSKFVFLGDPTQIDNPNLTERYNGLVYLSEKMKGNPMCAQVSLKDDESVRSTLAREAAKIL